MSVTYEVLVNRILRKLDDPAQSSYEEELVYDAVIAAHAAILPWVPCQSVALLTSGSADQTDFVLPANLYTIQALQEVSTGDFIPRNNLAPSTQRSPENYANYDWVEYPHGYISLSRSIDIGDQLRLWYFSYWSVPTGESDLSFVIKPPDAALSGIVLYAAMYCLRAKSSNTAAIRQWAQRQIDSGNPEDNPLRKQALSLYQDFINEMKLMPAFAKAPR